MVPVQFITHTTATISYEESAMLALRGGCRWIQLRMKDATEAEAEAVAIRVKEACKQHDAIFIIDDRVKLVKKLQADGVHLGKHDMPVGEARKFLGEGFLIGGTANTLDDIRALKRESADYIGCGPFRFTETKKNLSPILGIEGYQQIMEGMAAEGIDLPVCAIGGITLADVPAILQTGVQGIAVSGSILRACDPAKAMEEFIHCL